MGSIHDLLSYDSAVQLVSEPQHSCTRGCAYAGKSEAFLISWSRVQRCWLGRSSLWPWLLVQAYIEAFQPSDDVALIVHSSYGDHFWEQELQDSMQNSSQPAVLFFQVGPYILHTSVLQTGLSLLGVWSTLASLACHNLLRIFQGYPHAMIPDVHAQEALSHAEMLRLYRSADVYVSPYRSEGFGLGTLEALTLGLQVCCCWNPSACTGSVMCAWEF